MADQDFNIKVVTTADTSGIRQTSSELDALRSKVVTGGNKPGILLAPIPAELTGGVAQVAQETEKVAAASLLAGTNLARARNEAVTLIREISTGAPTARTLGALLGSFGPSLIGGALAGIFLKNAIDQVATETNKVSDELGKAGQKVIELGIKWRQAAREATSVEDVQRVAESGIADIDRLGQRIREVASSDLTTVQSVLDTVAAGFKNAFTFGGDPNATGPFQKLQDELIRGLGQQQELLVEQKRRAIEAARANEQVFEGLKTKPAQENINDLNTKLADLKSKQDATNVSTAEGQRRYAELGQQIAFATKELQFFNQELGKQQQTADKAYDASSTQTKAILLHEDAARKARESGQERDADLFQQSAENFRKSSPDAAAEADRIRKLYGGDNRPPGRTAGVGESQDLVDQMERQRIAAENAQRRTNEPGGETGTGGPSMIGEQARLARKEDLELAKKGEIGPAAEKRRMDSLEQTVKEGNAAMKDRLEELISISREQIGIWR